MKFPRVCGNCRHYEVKPDDLKLGLCYFKPPEAALIGPPVHGAGPQILSIRPPVKRDERGCSEFHAKEELLKPEGPIFADD